MRVGLCGWTVAQPAYVQRYRVVEVQHTFYDPPADGLLARWRRQVPLAEEVRSEVGAFRSTDYGRPPGSRPHTTVEADKTPWAAHAHGD